MFFCLAYGKVLTMNKFSKLLLVSVSATSLYLGGINSAMAQQNVKVRVGEHTQYSRIVFEWPNIPNYTVNKQGDQLQIIFEEAGAIDFSALNAQSLKNIGAISGDGKMVTLNVAPDSTFRNFEIGKKIILDVYNSKGSPTKAPLVITPAKVEPQTPTTMLENNNSIIVDAIAPQPVFMPEAKALTPTEPHVITFAATTKVGMAAFERAGFLWFILDDPNIAVPPRLDGPEKEAFPDFERIDIPGGVAYRMPAPEGVDVYGEGGGLLWRVVLSPNPRRLKPIQPEASFDGTSEIAGGTLFWPLVEPRKKLSVTDPIVGDTIHIVTVEDASQYGGTARDYVDMQMLSSKIGIAFAPWVDDLIISTSDTGVSVTKSGGLSLSRNRDTASASITSQFDEEELLNEFGEAPPLEDALSRIFNFERWEMGGIVPLEENRRVLMVGLGNKDGYGKVEDLVTIAKLNLANNRGAEALGVLRVAENELPGIEKNPEFIALRAAAATLAGQYDIAIPNLFDKELEKFGEAQIWKAAALAGLEDWRQANDVLPGNLDLVASYPKAIRFPIALKLGETLLRAAKIDEAESMLALIDDEKLSPSLQAGLDYLSAEALRQRGDLDGAQKLWEEQVNGRDDYYRAKAGLSLLRLQLEQNKITTAEAINRLEALRYAWRGDELETLINFRLGQVYVDNGDYLKGLSVLRNAVSLSPDSILSKEVTSYMTDTFRDLFMGGKLSEISPLDAVSIYDEFKELTPAGAQGDKFVQALAESLVDVDLLGRAGALLEDQINFRLKGEEAGRVGLRLAAIRLLDNKPDGALRALDLADQAYGVAAAENNNAYSEEKAQSKLLRARALSKLNRTDEAIDMLNLLAKQRGTDPLVSRIQADMAWQAGRWDDAAQAIQDLIIMENISLTRPVTDAQRDLIMNRAIALNLAGNRVALANLRERYDDTMQQTEKARMFELVTRPRQMGLLGSRDSVESLMSEVDLFGDFLENYRKMTE